MSDQHVSVVTGANSGIGRATAVHLAQQGHRVFGTVRAAAKAEKLLTMAEQAGVTVEIADTGCGMDAATKAKLFEPFFSMKEANQRMGSGLGLSVVHGLVSDHHGFMDVESEVDQGSKFTIFLPGAEAGEIKEEAKTAALPSGNARILVIDDEPAQRLLARRFLERLGYTVTVVSDGAEAVALFKAAKRKKEESPFDLVVVDMMMKGMDGVATSKAIRECYPDQKLMIASGHAAENQTAESQGLGLHWLPKPYSLSDLAEALKSQLPVRSR